VNTAPEVIEFRLTPAAALYREKLLLRRRNDLPANVRALPGFQFRSPVQPGAASESEKMLAQGMIRLVAATLMEKIGRDVNEMQFVSLMRLGVKANQYEFDFDCPFPVIVESMTSTQNARAAIERVADLKILQRLALPQGALVPVVFAYSRQKNELLVTNEHHLGNPQQFLDPEKCPNDLGFLEFPWHAPHARQNWR
jgi:hypothetical protein